MSSGPYFCDDFGQVYKMDCNGCWRFDGVSVRPLSKYSPVCFREEWTSVDTVPHHAVEADAGLIAKMMHLYELEALRPKQQKENDL